VRNEALAGFSPFQCGIQHVWQLSYHRQDAGPEHVSTPPKAVIGSTTALQQFDACTVLAWHSICAAAQITSGYPLMHYRVYARLARAGYIVYRCVDSRDARPSFCAPLMSDSIPTLTSVISALLCLTSLQHNIARRELPVARPCRSPHILL